MLIGPIDVYDAVATIAFIGGALLTIKSRIPQQTINNLKELSDSQAGLIKDLQRDRIKDVQAIADLQGQIKVYKELPLREMATALQEIKQVNETIADSNRQILTELRHGVEAKPRPKSKVLAQAVHKQS
jgi:hypothetical protein